MSEARKYTEAQKNSARKWDAANLDRISVAAPKGTKERWKAAATAQDKSLNQLIVEAVDNQISQDRRKAPSKAPQDPLVVEKVQLPSECEKVQKADQNGVTAKEES